MNKEEKYKLYWKGVDVKQLTKEQLIDALFEANEIIKSQNKLALEQS